MNKPIIIPPLLIGKALSEQINDHNARVERVWREIGSNCKPYRPSPSTVPAAENLSRVSVAEQIPQISGRTS